MFCLPNIVTSDISMLTFIVSSLRETYKGISGCLKKIYFQITKYEIKHLKKTNVRLKVWKALKTANLRQQFS